jgi:hypothetical protein
MRNYKFIEIVVVALSVIPLAVNAHQPTPITIARQFYRWNINYASSFPSGSSLPSGREIIPIKSLLDPSLLKTLYQAKTVENCLTKLANPSGNKPDIFEGNIFAGNFEGIAKINNLKVSKKNNIAIVTASLIYRSHLWVDRLIMHEKSGHWLIFDLKYKSGKSLSEQLTSYVEQYQSTCQLD